MMKGIAPLNSLTTTPATTSSAPPQISTAAVTSSAPVDNPTALMIAAMERLFATHFPPSVPTPASASYSKECTHCGKLRHTIDGCFGLNQTLLAAVRAKKAAKLAGKVKDGDE